MAKYQVTRKDGKVEDIELFGNVASREARITWLESTYSDEYIAKNNGYEVINMTYAEYKKNFSDCKTVSNSYDKKTKTIDVLVKIKQPEAPAVEEEVTEESVEVVSEAKSIEAIAADHHTDVATLKTISSMPVETIKKNLELIKTRFSESDERYTNLVDCLKELKLI